MFKENPLSILQIFVSEQRELIQSSIHFYGKKVRVGSYLREYDYSKRELDSWEGEAFGYKNLCLAAKLIVRMLRPYINIQNRWALPTLQFV
jgi:hypothetical protein